MHNLQNKIYASEAEIKAQIEKFDDGINGSQKIKNFFDKNGINTTEKIKEFNDLYATTEQAKRGIYDADVAIQTKVVSPKNGADSVAIRLEYHGVMLAISNDADATIIQATLSVLQQLC